MFIPTQVQQGNKHLPHKRPKPVPKSPTNHRRKIDEIETLMINENKIDIICLSETWLDNHISDDDVKINDYKIYRKDRTANIAGGAAVYITDAIPHRRADEYELPDIDLLWVDIKHGNKKIMVGACYRPPANL